MQLNTVAVVSLVNKRIEQCEELNADSLKERLTTVLIYGIKKSN